MFHDYNMFVTHRMNQYMVNGYTHHIAKCLTFDDLVSNGYEDTYIQQYAITNPETYITQHALLKLVIQHRHTIIAFLLEKNNVTQEARSMYALMHPQPSTYNLEAVD